MYKYFFLDIFSFSLNDDDVVFLLAASRLSRVNFQQHAHITPRLMAMVHDTDTELRYTALAVLSESVEGRQMFSEIESRESDDDEIRFLIEMFRPKN